MFKTQKGNKYMEILSPTDKILVNQWKMHSSVRKEYDVEAKTYVYDVGGTSPIVKLSLPKDQRHKLDLCYPLLVLELCFPAKASILIDIGISSSNNQRKRITLSSKRKPKSIQSSSLTSVLPFTVEIFESWMHVLVDVEDIVSNIWNGVNFKGIDFLGLSGVFRLKRIFLLSRDLVHETEGTYMINYDEVPNKILHPKNILQYFKYISSSCDTLKEINLENQSLSSTRSSRNSTISCFSGRYNQQQIESKSCKKYSSDAESPIRQTAFHVDISSVDKVFIQNLSNLSFREKSNKGKANELHLSNSPVKDENSDDDILDGRKESIDERNIDVRMPSMNSKN